jgi:hypothetical protein
MWASARLVSWLLDGRQGTSRPISIDSGYRTGVNDAKNEVNRITEKILLDFEW